jgi:hypothetical protein
MAKKPPHPGGPGQTDQDDARGKGERGPRRSPDLHPSGGRYTTSDGSDVWDLDKGKDRPEWMVSIRESDEHDQMMFDGMRDQTYQLLRHLPFIEQVRKAGMEPMAADGSFELEVAEGDAGSRRAVQVRRLRRGNTTVIVFRYGPAVHVWCMASAAKIHNDDRINDFTWLLMELVLAYRPRNVFTANLSRVIRSLEQAGLLLHALVGNVDAIWHGSQRLALAGPEASTGKFQYNMLASFAAMERVAILQRLMAGRVARFRMGRWVPGRKLVPPGYVLDAKTGLLEVDERQREMIAAMLEILGSGAPSRATLMAIGKIGMKMPHAVDEDGNPVPASHATTSTATTDALLAWLNTWIHGQYLYRFSNGGLEIDDLSGVPVVRRNDSDMGEFQMLLSVPLPEGGWASTEVLGRAVAVARERWADFIDMRGEPRPLHPSIEHACVDPELAQMQFRRRNTAGSTLQVTRSGKPRRGPTGGAARAQVAPLIGRRWNRDGIVFRIGGMNSGKYRITATAADEDVA